ncbi:MAG: universal stress protein [Saprospiraceae bacterium]|nr:universal stress protein [Saprospiraceae bacterium]
MYKIIVPTDFSGVSKNALLYSVSLINNVGGHISLVNFYTVPNVTGHQKLMEQMVRDGVEKEMEKLVVVTTQWIGQGETIDSRVIRGQCAEGLVKWGKEDDYDMIIMGSQGSSNKMKLILGSTAKTVVNKVDLPTLIVPPMAKYQAIRNVVLADDGDLQESNLRFIAKLGLETQGHLYILNVGEIKIQKEIIDQYGKILKDFSYSFHNIEGDDVLNSMNYFTEEVDADLLVMTKRRKSFFQKIFGISHTDLELFRTSIPLLILHEHDD